MRTVKEIQYDVQAIKVAIQEARQANDEQELDLLYDDLQEMQEELYRAKTTTN
jgi:uncharacterized membrane protein (DUF106 family)